MEKTKPHPSNVPGDYFVEDGCCMMCEVPSRAAPDLFAVSLDPTGCPHCFVKKQPETADEQDRMFLAIRRAEAGCIRYRGCERAVQERLVEAGEGTACVDLPADLQRKSAERIAAFEQTRRWPQALWKRLTRLGRGKHQS
jgi:hypothetical protein